MTDANCFLPAPTLRRSPGKTGIGVSLLDKVAEMRDVSRAAADYNWIMAHPARPIPIIGSQDDGRIREAADAYKINWTRDDWYDVLVASRWEKLP